MLLATLPLQTEVQAVQPNNLMFGISLAPRLSNNDVLLAMSLTLYPIKSEVVGDVTVHANSFAAPATWSTADLDRYVQSDATIAALVQEAYTAVLAMVNAINAKESLI